MPRGTRNEQELAEIRNLAEQVERLTGEVAALTTLKDRTAELNTVTAQVETKKLEIARLTEAHAREKRETEHDVGLLRKQLQQDTANQEKIAKMAEQAAVLKVREENLSADKTRFADEMQFQRQQMMNEMNGLKEIVGQLMQRLPVIDVSLTDAATLSSGRHAEKAS